MSKKTTSPAPSTASPLQALTAFVAALAQLLRDGTSLQLIENAPETGWEHAPVSNPRGGLCVRSLVPASEAEAAELPFTVQAVVGAIFPASAPGLCAGEMVQQIVALINNAPSAVHAGCRVSLEVFGTSHSLSVPASDIAPGRDAFAIKCHITVVAE